MKKKKSIRRLERDIYASAVGILAAAAATMLHDITKAPPPRKITREPKESTYIDFEEIKN